MENKKHESLSGIKCEVTDCVYHTKPVNCTADAILVKKESQKSADCYTYTKKETMI